ncbi:hypothetical protein LINPERHAP2_LOCUS36504 [Linum perenne]
MMICGCCTAIPRLKWIGFWP